MTLNLVFRGFANGVLQFEQPAAFDVQNLEGLLTELATEHMAFLAGHESSMIEIEYLDEPDVSKRFFRIGYDPALMRDPVRLDLDTLTARSQWKDSCEPKAREAPMKVTFTKEHRDPATGRTYKANEQAEVSDEQAKKLVQEGTARENDGGQQKQEQR